MTGTRPLASRGSRGSSAGALRRITFFERIVAADIRIIEPGTSAVSTPAAPMIPTSHGSNVLTLTRSRARSASFPWRPGTSSSAAKPTKKTNSITS